MTYTFKCEPCNISKEVKTDMLSIKMINERCPICFQVMKRIYDVPVIKFNGSGFYCNDNKKVKDD